MLEALVMSHADFTDDEGRHLFSQFLLHEGLRIYVTERDNDLIIATAEAVNLLQAQIGLDTKTFDERLFLAAMMFLNAVVMLDLQPFTAARRKKYLSQVIDMSLAALRA